MSYENKLRRIVKDSYNFNVGSLFRNNSGAVCRISGFTKEKIPRVNVEWLSDKERATKTMDLKTLEKILNENNYNQVRDSKVKDADFFSYYNKIQNLKRNINDLRKSIKSDNSLSLNDETSLLSLIDNIAH